MTFRPYQFYRHGSDYYIQFEYPYAPVSRTSKISIDGNMGNDIMAVSSPGAKLTDLPDGATKIATHYLVASAYIPPGGSMPMDETKIFVNVSDEERRYLNG